MEYKKPTEQNFLKYTIEKQLQKDQVSSKNAVQSKSYAPAPEIKSGNIFNNWLSKLIGKNKESGLIIAQQKINEKQNQEQKTPKALSNESSKSQLKNSQEVRDIKFDKFHEVVPLSQKNKSATLSASKSNEVSSKLPLPESKLLSTFQGEIKETKKGLVGVNQFQGKIQESTKILKNSLTKVNLFEGKIQDKSKDLSKAPQVKDLKETLAKKTTKKLDPKVDIAIKNNKKNNKNTKEQMKAAESQKEEAKQSSRVLVTVSTNSDGKITHLDVFKLVQPSRKALGKGYSANTKVSQILTKARKKGRSMGNNYGKINLSRGG